jgi:predicted DNA-binding WGR domain protein
MPRYELVSKTANKFWEIALAGSAFETRWGRRGTPGRTGEKKFANAAKAKAAYDRIVAEKVREGYALVSSGSSGGKARPAKAAKTAKAGSQPARSASLASAVTKQLRRLGATVDGGPQEPVPIAQFTRLRIGVRGGRNAQRERFEKKIKDWRKVIDAMRVWEKANPLPADRWHTGQPGARDPYRQLTHVPVPVATFIQRVKWSRELSHEGLYGQIDLDMYSSGNGIDVELKDKRRVLCSFGHDENHEYFLDALDASPDPMVYTTDEDGLGEYDMCKLSIFLKHVRLKRR